MNQYIELRDKYNTGEYKIKFVSKKGRFSLDLYNSFRIPLIGKIAYGKSIMSVDISLTQMGFAQSLYLSSFKQDHAFGRENRINFAEYKAYVMHGFMENATNTDMDFAHCFVGMIGELGETIDNYKKIIWHKKHIDRVKVLEETSDFLWYFTAFLALADISLAELMAINKAKLDERYKNGRNDLTFRDTKIEYELMSKIINNKHHI